MISFMTVATTKILLATPSFPDIINHRCKYGYVHFPASSRPLFFSVGPIQVLIEILITARKPKLLQASFEYFLNVAALKK